MAADGTPNIALTGTIPAGRATGSSFYYVVHHRSCSEENARSHRDGAVDPGPQFAKFVIDRAAKSVTSAPGSRDAHTNRAAPPTR